MYPQTIAAWLRRLAALDSKVFADVRSNPTATIPAVAVALVATLLSGLGGWLWWVMQGYDDRGRVFIDSAVLGSLLAVALWGVIWVGLVYLLLTQFFRERVFLEQLLRVMGVGMAPLALTVLMVIPGISLGLGLGALALTFGLTNIAIQSVTTADPMQVLAANLIGFTVWAGFLTFFVSAGNVYAPGVFVYVWPSELSADLFDRVNQFNNIVQ